MRLDFLFHYLFIEVKLVFRIILMQVKCLFMNPKIFEKIKFWLLILLFNISFLINFYLKFLIFYSIIKFILLMKLIICFNYL